MGVRPPSNGPDDEPDSIEFGIAAVEPHLERRDVSFPATKDDLAAEIGSERVAYDASGGTVSIGEILAEVDRERFESETDLLNALHPEFEAYRKRHGGGVVEQVRSMLPF